MTLLARLLEVVSHQCYVLHSCMYPAVLHTALVIGNDFVNTKYCLPSI